MELLSDLWTLLRTRRRLWLLPLILVLLTVGGLVVLTEGSVFMPFVYFLF